MSDELKLVMELAQAVAEKEKSVLKQEIKEWQGELGKKVLNLKNAKVARASETFGVFKPEDLQVKCLIKAELSENEQIALGLDNSIGELEGEAAVVKENIAKAEAALEKLRSDELAQAVAEKEKSVLKQEIKEWQGELGKKVLNLKYAKVARASETFGVFKLEDLQVKCLIKAELSENEQIALGLDYSIGELEGEAAVVKENIAKAEAALEKLRSGEDVATKLAAVRGGKVPTSAAGKSANSAESQTIDSVFCKLNENTKWMPFDTIPSTEKTPTTLFGILLSQQRLLRLESCFSNQNYKFTREFVTPSGVTRSLSGIPDYLVCLSSSFDKIKPAKGCGLDVLHDTRKKLKVVLIKHESGDKGRDESIKQLAVTMWCFNKERVNRKIPLYGIVICNNGLIHPLKLTTTNDGQEQIHTDGCLSSGYVDKLCLAMLKQKVDEAECWNVNEVAPTRKKKANKVKRKKHA